MATERHMRLLFFGTASIQNAGIRYRLMRFADLLVNEGHVCHVCLPSSSTLWIRLWSQGNRLTKALYLLIAGVTRIFQLRHIFRADVIFFRGPVMPYGLGPPLFEYAIRFFNPRLVFDIDDAVWMAPDGVVSPFLGLVDHRWIWKMCRICAHGIVGNQYLKNHVGKYHPNVTVIPTCIDSVIHTKKTYREISPTDPVILGWTGLSSNLVYIKEIEEVLRQLSCQYRIALLVASDRDYHLDGVRVINRRWHLQHEIEYLKETDIGLMPLSNSEYALGKCAFKALQFMGVGTPCVVSPVGMNAEVVQDGVNGFLADSPREWYEKLERLITNAALRRRMGEAARDTVLQHYSHEIHYSTLKMIFEHIAESR